jgi:glycosyltransferase involved in cell wall biosynthesis
MDKPLVSIVLPVYNAGVYLKEAIQSILDQTYTNFELIIINDGSTDDSEKLIKSFTDDRIRYIYQQNTGLAGALNTGLKASNGKYIARQDQDDISLKERLQKQVEFLEKHPNVNLLGTRAQVFTDDQKEMKMHDHATVPAILHFDLLFDNPFVHSSVMFRKESIEQIGYYNDDRSYFEDYELWSRFVLKGKVANLRDVLVYYRHHEQGLSKSKNYFKEDAVYNQSLNNIRNLILNMDDTVIDMIAVYHVKLNKYKNSTFRQINNGLNNLALKLITLYPNDKELISERKKQYSEILRYKLNQIKRIKNKDKPVKIFLLKLETKIFGSHPYIKND